MRFVVSWTNQRFPGLTRNSQRSAMKMAASSPCHGSRFMVALRANALPYPEVFWTQMAFAWWDFIWIWSLIIFILGQGLFHGSSPYCLSPAAIARAVVNSSTLRTLGSHQTLGLQTLPLIVHWTRKQSHVSSNSTSQTLVQKKKQRKHPAASGQLSLPAWRSSGPSRPAASVPTCPPWRRHGAGQNRSPNLNGIIQRSIR